MYDIETQLYETQKNTSHNAGNLMIKKTNNIHIEINIFL